MYHGQRCVIYTLVSEIQENVDLVLGNQKCVQIRSYKLTGLLFKIFEQIPTHLSKRMCCAQTQRAGINQSEGSICR